MREPAGRSHPIAGGGYRAELVEVGAGLRILTRDGVDLVAGYPDDAMCPASRGAVLMPWPNRIEDGAYSFEGVTYQVPVNEVERNNALHGLVSWVRWEVESASEWGVRFAYALPPQPGYPFALDLTVEYTVDESGLQVAMEAINVGTAPAPYGCGFHPYLTVGRQINSCLLTLPAQTWPQMSPRLLPTTPADVAGTAFDFRSPRLVGDTVLDHAFGGIDLGSGTAVARLEDPDTGRAVQLRVDAAWPWMQVFSADPLGDEARASLAVEPMTCPPNAFVSGTDLVVLAPGASHRAAFTIS